MNPQPPSDHVREIVGAFLQANGLLPVVDVSHGPGPYGDEVMSLKPRAAGAAEVVVQTAGDAGRYSVHVFVAGEGRPIEIAGPIDVNTDPPFRTADEALLEILHLVATGQVFDEVDREGQIVGSDVPDPRAALQTEEGAGRRRWHQPWA